MSFSEKFDRILNASIKEDVRVITAVPTWILTLFQRVLEVTGCLNIQQVWPNLELIISGGVKLANYRSHLESLCGTLEPDFIETYGASEGYFSYTDAVGEKDMKLVLDNGIFYEWVPYEHDSSIQESRILPTWNIEKGVPYEMLVTTNAGLWRYRVKDVIEFTSLNPPKIRVKGRTQEVLDDHGEAVYGWEAEKALTECTEQLGLDFDQFTIGSHLDSKHARPRHYWFILFKESKKIPSSTLHKLEESVDDKLQSINRHYAIRRNSDALVGPRIYKINFSTIQHWLDNKGELRAQSKLPRILSHQTDIEMMLNLSGNTSM